MTLEADSRFLSPEQLSEILNVPISTIYYWRKQPGFPTTKFGRHLRFNLKEVEAYFSKKSEDTTNSIASSPSRAIELPCSLTIEEGVKRKSEFSSRKSAKEDLWQV